MAVDSDPNGFPIQKVLRDLVALCAVPSVRLGRESQDIAIDLADLLATSLKLNFAFVRLRDGNGGVEVARGRQKASVNKPTISERTEFNEGGEILRSDPPVQVIL